MKLQKLGGYAAIAVVFSYITIVALAIPFGAFVDAAKTMAAVSAAPTRFYLYSLLWIIMYVLMLTTFFALRERMKAAAPNLTSAMFIAVSAAAAMAFAESIINLKSIGFIISAQDLSAFRACLAVTEGLHWAGGHACGWVYLFLGCAILKTREFSRTLGWLSLLTGILWIPNVFFVQLGFAYLTFVYILTGCISAVWIGIVLLRQKQPQSEAMAASK
jgi:hypothetical protein